VVAAVVIALLLLIGGGGTAIWKISGDYHVEAYQEKLDKADAKIKEQADEIIAIGKKGIEDQKKAYLDGKANAEIVTKTITVRGAADVARYPVFQNTQCVLPPESLAFLNAARTSLRTGALPADSSAVAPAFVAPPTAAPQAAVPAAPAGPPPPAGARGSSHPKPKPVQK
jgi:hypothetical protein